MKRLSFFIGIVAVLAVVFSSSITLAAFPDVSSTHDNFDAIEYVQAQGIVAGYPDGTFKPNQKINRAEFTKIIMEAAFPGISKGSDCFPDVLKEWFAKYICEAKLKNIIGGYPDGTFRPDQDISFVEAAKIIVLTLGYEVGADDVWFKPFVDALAERNAIPLSITDFNQYITRGEMAEMIYRLKADITDKPSTSYNKLAGIVEEPKVDIIPEDEIPPPDEEEPEQMEDITEEEEPTVEEEDPIPAVRTILMSVKQFDFAPQSITVQLGETIRLEITSIDVQHGFSFPEFKINEVLNPNQTVIVEFTPDKTGSHLFFCSVFCGSGHSRMQGFITVE